MQDNKLQIEYLPIDQLQMYDGNANIHTAHQIDQIAESIEEFDFSSPILAWHNEDGEAVIIAGHGRLMAARKLGIEELPVVFLDHMTDEQRRAFTIVENQLTRLSEFDMGILEVELENIVNIDMTQFDFDVQIEDDVFDDGYGEVEEDEVPEDAPSIVQKGDVWQLGRHRLMCGDSTDVAAIDRLMDGVKADMVFTDPPYGMKKESEGVLNDNLNFDDLLDFNRQWIPLTFGALKDNGSWYCWGIDEPLMDIYSNILKPMAKENKITFRNLITWDKGNGQGQLSEDFRMYPIADEKCLFVMMGTQGFAETSDNMEWCKPIVEKIAEKAKAHGLTPKKMKETIGHSTNSPDHFLNYALFRFPKREYYEAWFCDGEYDELKQEYDELKQEFCDGRAYFDNTHDNMNNVWHFDRAGKDEREHTGGHATPKPIALCSRAIKSSSREGEIVLDVFGGSGSTLIACEQLGRKCYMMELDPHYCDVIIARWEKLTGLKAEKVI